VQARVYIEVVDRLAIAALSAGGRGSVRQSVRLFEIWKIRLRFRAIRCLCSLLSALRTVCPPCPMLQNADGELLHPLAPCVSFHHAHVHRKWKLFLLLTHAELQIQRSPGGTETALPRSIDKTYKSSPLKRDSFLQR
jgi:hypothetical protein